MALTGGTHLYGDIMEIQATVRETVTVAPGNIMILNSIADLIANGSLSGASTTPDNYAYPIGTAAYHGPTQWVQNANARFLGVAMDDSAKVTNTIAIATAGAFRFPLSMKSAVTLGAIMSGVSNHSTFSVNSSTSDSYAVAGGSTESGATLGRCLKTESGASKVDVMIRTMLGFGGVIT